MSCAVRCCKNFQRAYIPGISFHRFPRNELLKVWLQVLNLSSDTFKWSKNKMICSKHFHENQYKVIGEKRFLKKDAVPNLFLIEEIPPETFQAGPSSGGIVQTSSGSIPQKGSSKMRRPLKRKSSINLEINSSSAGVQESELSKNQSGSTAHESSGTSSSTKRQRISQRIHFFHSYSASPRKLKEKNLELRKCQEQYRKRLYEANKKVKKLNKEVTCLTTVIEYLKKQDTLSENAAEHLKNTFDSVPTLLMARYLKNVQNETISHEA